ncbi:MAG: triose-phosphate isomerase [Ruminococcaceae bacterium]|nr:triose-phosphate isomerase [Oscillospiraceae bacterium]
MRKKVIAGNWKMNKTPSETKALIEELIPLVKNTDDTVIVCPTAACLAAATETANGTNIKVGAQNMFYEESGAFTGEISADMLLDLGVEYVILGHSERRQYFAETDETVNLKVLKAFEKGLLPIICVGESLEQREQGITNDLVRMQTKIALKGVSSENAKKAIIAYEPIWAIGTGKTATTEQAQEVCKAIRDCVCEIYGKDVADVITIQYGGSVKAANSKELFEAGDIDGGLVGGASLKAADFEGIVNYK